MLEDDAWSDGAITTLTRRSASRRRHVWSTQQQESRDRELDHLVILLEREVERPVTPPSSPSAGLLARVCS